MSSKTPFSQILERSAILRRHCDVTRQGQLFVARPAVFACGDGYLFLLERPALAISPSLYSLHERQFARSPLPRFFAFAERPGGPLRRGLFTYPCRAYPITHAAVFIPSGALTFMTPSWMSPFSPRFCYPAALLRCTPRARRVLGGLERSVGNVTLWLILCRNALGQSVTHSLKGYPNSRYESTLIVAVLKREKAPECYEIPGRNVTCNKAPGELLHRRDIPH